MYLYRNVLQVETVELRSSTTPTDERLGDALSGPIDFHENHRPTRRLDFVRQPSLIDQLGSVLSEQETAAGWRRGSLCCISHKAGCPADDGPPHPQATKLADDLERSHVAGGVQATRTGPGRRPQAGLEDVGSVEYVELTIREARRFACLVSRERFPFRYGGDGGGGRRFGTGVSHIVKNTRTRPNGKVPRGGRPLRSYGGG